MGKGLIKRSGFQSRVEGGGVGGLIELFREVHDYEFQRKSSQKTTIYII